MELLALAGIAFVALHTLPATPLRAKLVAAMGENAYMGLFSALAPTILFLWTRAFAAAPVDERLWFYADWWPWLKAAVPLVAMFLFVGGVSATSPASPGAEAVPDRPDVAKGIFAITRHPLLWGIGLWAVTHLISQPNLRSLLFFGLIALVAFGGAKLQDFRKATALGERWKPFATQTSYLPFAAMIQGRAKPRFGDIGWWRVSAAIVLWAVLIYFHTWLFSASPLPGWL